MSFSKKVVVAVDLGKDLSEVLNPIKEMSFLAQSEIHFVHVFNTITYSFIFGDFPTIYPVEADRSLIEKSIVSILENTSKTHLPSNFQGKVIHQCLFADDAKDKFSEYVKGINADLVLVATREKHGIFDSSFAQYLVKHTNANILVLKHKT
jgi:hypothetical protein